jgi:hypothetical protein
LSLEQGVEFGAAQLNLIRRVFDEH